MYNDNVQNPIHLYQEFVPLEELELECPGTVYSVEIWSDAMPLCGQKSRASMNFYPLCKGDYVIQPSDPNVSFKLKKDISIWEDPLSLGADPTHFTYPNTDAGNMTHLDPGSRYYIGGVRNAEGSFKVTFSLYQPQETREPIGWRD